ncbi:MAG: hypothetical protein ACOX6L_02885 [Syntrophomonadaceae bacterium]|jgi:hypothetical protein
MESSQVSLSKVMFNILSPNDQGLQLNKGEILRGVVQDIKLDGLVVLALKGRMIEALTEVAVSKGQQLFLQVDDFRNGKAYLKVLTPQALETAEKANLSANLKEIGLPVRDSNIVMAQKLIQYELPVSKSMMSELARGTALLGESSARNLELAAFALKNQIPITREALSLLAQSASSTNNNIARLVQDLVQVLSKLTQNPGTITGQNPSISQTSVNTTLNINIGQTVNPGVNATPNQASPMPPSNNMTGINNAMVVNQNNETIKDSVNLSTGRGGDSLPVNMTAAPSSAASAVDGRTITLIPTGETNIAFPSSGETTTGQRLAQVLNMLTGLLSEAEVVPGDKESIGPRLQQLIQSRPELVRAITWVKNILENEIQINRNPQLTELVSKLGGLEKELTAQQLFNAISRPASEAPLPYFYFSFPVKMDNDLYHCELRLNRENKRDLKSMDHIRFIVSLDTSRMGLVVFHVDWNKSGILEIQGVVQNSTVKEHLSANAANLENELSALGYKVVDKGIKIAKSTADLPGERLQFSEIEAPATGRFSIDVIV